MTKKEHHFETKYPHTEIKHTLLGNTLESAISIANAFVGKLYNLTVQKQQAVKEYEEQIDLMVYKLYDLTHPEVLVIDPTFTLSEEEYNIYEVQ